MMWKWTWKGVSVIGFVNINSKALENAWMNSQVPPLELDKAKMIRRESWMETSLLRRLRPMTSLCLVWTPNEGICCMGQPNSWTIDSVMKLCVDPLSTRIMTHFPYPYHCTRIFVQCCLKGDLGLVGWCCADFHVGLFAWCFFVIICDPQEDWLWVTAAMRGGDVSLR